MLQKPVAPIPEDPDPIKALKQQWLDELGTPETPEETAAMMELFALLDDPLVDFDEETLACTIGAIKKPPDIMPTARGE